jgi:hypothetical protein
VRSPRSSFGRLTYGGVIKEAHYFYRSLINGCPDLGGRRLRSPSLQLQSKLIDIKWDAVFLEEHRVRIRPIQQSCCLIISAESYRSPGEFKPHCPNAMPGG